jgi:hypothetical protein
MLFMQLRNYSRCVLTVRKLADSIFAYYCAVVVVSVRLIAVHHSCPRKLTVECAYEPSWRSPP